MAFEECKEFSDFKTYECIAQKHKISGLPNEITKMCKNGYITYLGEHKFKLFTHDSFTKIMKKLSDGGVNRRTLHEIYNHTENIEDERGLFFAIFRACERGDLKFSPDVAFNLKITTYMDTVEITVMNISN